MIEFICITSSALNPYTTKDVVYEAPLKNTPNVQVVTSWKKLNSPGVADIINNST